MQEPFMINGKFLVNPEKNTVTDTGTGEEARLEQRLLAVLYLLAATPGELVNREMIISSVWNDYGGADEALTQAISHLRKVLGDKDKKIIETIPKKGYVLNATVGMAYPVKGEKQVVATPNKRAVKYVIALLVAAVIAVVIYFSMSTATEDNHPTDVLPQSKRGADNMGGDVPPDTVRSANPDMVPDSLRGAR